MDLKIYVDGGSRGNPGNSAVGVVIFDAAGKLMEEYKKYIGIATNNVAEYEALIAAIDLAKKYNPDSVTIHIDSELIYNQMIGNYKVKNENMLVCFQKAQRALCGFERVKFVSIPREQNKHADKLVNQALNIAENLNKQ
jgi:ribonuclease HI